MKRGIALLLTLCMTLAIIPSALAAESSFTINGVTVSASSGSSVWNCSTYAGEILKKVWKGYNGQSVVTTTFNSSYNMLKGKSADERKITEAHTKTYIQAAPLGSRVRITHYSSNARDNYDNNQYGHTLVLVAKNDFAGTFTMLEAGGGRGETNTYTYKSFSEKWSNFRVGYTYFFYIADLSCFGSEEKEPCTTHTKGEYRTFEANHPHHSIYKCAMCGKDFADQNTSTYYAKCNICNPPLQTPDFIWPLKNGAGSVSSAAGVLRSGYIHVGTDIAASAGTPILAIADGTIATAQYNSERGHYIKIDHGDYYCTYQHMQSEAVVRSGKVTQGQVIGYVGSTGASSGNHLHFEMVQTSSCPAGNKDLYTIVNILKKTPTYYAVTRGEKVGDYYALNLSQVERVDEKEPCTTHTKGEYRTFEANHPHHSIYKCAVCGEDYADKNTSQYYEKCARCNPPQETPITCTVTFDPNGGSVSQTSKQVVKGELIGAVPTAIRTGYTFAGWSFSKDAPELIISDSNTGVYITEDTTLYALWNKNLELGPEPEPEPESYWGSWSEWQDSEVRVSDTREVEFRQVEDTPAHTEYRYGRWVNSEPFDHFCPEAAVNSGHRNDFRVDYTPWSETQLIESPLRWFCTDRTHDHQHCAARSRTYNGKTGDAWNGYKTSANAVADYYWEETRAVPVTYKTQYRYRDLVSGG